MVAIASRWWACVRWWVLLLALLPGAGRALEPAARTFQDYRALVVSGGSSLGVYEAGLLHAFSYVRAVAQEVRPPSRQELEQRPVVVGGTSAGALNAFLTALSLCQRPTPDPEKSLFTLWLQLDWNDLLPEGGRDEPPAQFEGAATRRKIRELMEGIRARWVDSDAWVDCRVQMGVAVTYLIPRAEPLPGSSIKLARSTERFMVSFTGERGRRPIIRVIRQLEGARPEECKRGEEGAWGAEARRCAFPVLGPDRQGDTRDERNIEELFPLLLASSGIPIVFDPVTLDVLYPDGKEERSAFIDGGAFDNVPLSTVVRLLEAGRTREEQGAAQARDRSLEAGQIVYVDADNVTWEAPAVRPPRKGGVEGYLAVLQGAVAGARQAELLRALDGADWVGTSLRLPRRHHLITGQMLGAFGAFFDGSFRRFDFAAGVVDAEAALEDLGPSLRILRDAGLLRALDEAIPELACFRRAWKPTKQGEEGREEIERALRSDECAALRDAKGEGGEARILRDEWRLLRVLLEMAPDERGLSQAFYGRLARVDGVPGHGRGYEWVTLKSGAGPAGPREGERAIREQLQRLVVAVARKNDDGNPLYRAVLASLGTGLADGVLEERRPEWMLSFGLYDGGVEVEGARSAGGAFQFAGGVQFGSGGFSEHQGRNGFTDVRALAGLRADAGLTAGVKLRPGVYAVGQGLLIYHQHPVYRLGVTGRLDVDLVKRIYAGFGMTRFLRRERGWPDWDPAIGAGVRVWW